MQTVCAYIYIRTSTAAVVLGVLILVLVVVLKPPDCRELSWADQQASSRGLPIRQGDVFTFYLFCPCLFLWHDRGCTHHFFAAGSLLWGVNVCLRHAA